MKKRFLITMLAIVTVMAIIPVMSLAALAETATGTTGDCTWTFDDATGTLTISGEGVIGSDQSWEEHMNSITSIVIEDGITSIANYAFYGCTSLESVTLPASLATIGNYAFTNCSNLKSVTIPASVTKIGNSAFYRCASLATVDYLGKSAPEVGDYVFVDCNLTAVNVPDDYEGDAFGDLGVSKTLVDSPSTPEAEQYYLTLYWGLSYTEELGYIIDKAPMVYDEELGLYTYTLEETVLKGDGFVNMRVCGPDKKEIDSGSVFTLPSDTYSFSVDFTFQHEREFSSLKIEQATICAPPQWRNGHVVVIDSNDDNNAGKSDQYIQLNPENGIYTATVENMDAFDGGFLLLIDGVVQGIVSITIPTDGSTVIFTSDGNAFGYTIVDSEPTPTYVAEVNGTPYDSIANAIDAAEATENSTLKLLADVTEEIVIEGGKFTLDLNGYIITGTSYGVSIYHGDIIITDSSDAKTGIISGSDGVYTECDTLTINGGTMTGDFGVIVAGGECTINGGTVNAVNYGVITTGGNCTINGGTIIGVMESVVWSGGRCSITGGSFNTDPYEYVAEGYAATWNSETNMYDVVVKSAVIEPTYVAEVNGTAYNSIAAAISAAEATEGSTLKLLADVTEVIIIEGGNFTLDLNGFGINSTADALTVINGDITITDSSSDRTGTIFGESCGLIVYGGSCTVSGGTVSGTLYGVYVQDAACEITGGNIIGGTDGVNVISGTCKITGGFISSENYGVFIRDGSCIITGGIINGDYIGVYVYGGSLSVSGGAFSTGINSKYIADGYIAVHNAETGMYDVVACTPPAITGVTFNSDSDGYDSENNVFYITDETPLIITVTGTNMEMFNEFYHIAFLYNGNGPMVKASSVTATEAKLIVDSSVIGYIIEGLELLASTSDTTGFGIGSLKKTELTYYTELSIKKGAPQTPTYTVELPSDTENGAVSSDVSSAKVGDTVTLTLTPAEGYELESVTVTDMDGKPVELENNSFVMPEGGVKISATFSPVPEVTVPGTDDVTSATDAPDTDDVTSATDAPSTGDSTTSADVPGTDSPVTTGKGSDVPSNDNTLFIVITVVAVLVAVGGAAAWVAVSGKNKKKTNK